MKLGCGLYGTAYEMEKDLWGSLKKYREAGFTAIEPFYGIENMVLDSSVPSRLHSIIWSKREVLEYQPKLKELGLEISSIYLWSTGNLVYAVGRR